MKYVKVLLVLLAAVIFIRPGKAQDSKREATKTRIVLLRHAEKELTGSNPPLSSEGKSRAEGLAKFLTDIKPDRFYSTDYLRTQQTLEPWAKAMGKEITVYDAGKQDAFASLLKEQRGKTIVVAGHSNTIPSLVNKLTGMAFGDLPDNEFGRIFVVTITGKDASLELRSY